MHSDRRGKELKQTNRQIKNSKESLSHWDTKIQPQLDHTFPSEESCGDAKENVPVLRTQMLKYIYRYSMVSATYFQMARQ